MEKVTDRLRRALSTILFWTMVLAGLGLLFLVAALPVVRQRHTMEVMVEQMTARNVALFDELDRLEKEQIALTGDPFYVEKLARRSLNMTREGEMQVTIVPAGYQSHRRTAERQMGTVQPVGLYRMYTTLKALAEDNLLRQVAIILGGATVIAGILLFGRSFETDRRTS